jgi:hypothetical protein
VPKGIIFWQKVKKVMNLIHTFDFTMDEVHNDKIMPLLPYEMHNSKLFL